MVARAWIAAALLLAAPAARAEDPHAGHAHEPPPASATAPAAREPGLPPGEESARAALDQSPRHGEFVDVAVPGSATPIRTWVVYPERREKAGVVLLIHEIYGLSDWLRAVADQCAREGFIAVAPDLISGFGPGGGGTESVASRDSVVQLVRNLTSELTRARLDAVTDWASRIPSANGRVATLGFCWGGGRSFEYAALQPRLRAAVVYYGASPDSALLPEVKVPVLGLYGGDDARVDATIEPAKRVLDRLHRRYEPHVYEGAGHGFLRAQSLRDGANQKAARQAWPRTVTFLRRYLE